VCCCCISPPFHLAACRSERNPDSIRIHHSVSHCPSTVIQPLFSAPMFSSLVCCIVAMFCAPRRVAVYLKQLAVVIGTSQCPTARTLSGVISAELQRTRTPFAVVSTVASGICIIKVADVFSSALNVVPLAKFMACAIACTVVVVIKSAMCAVIDLRKPLFELQCAMCCLTFSTLAVWIKFASFVELSHGRARK